MDKKIISIYMGNPDNSNHAELELPATPWELVDAMDRLRLSEGQEPYWQVEDMGRYEFLAPHLDGYDLYQFNALAEKLRTFGDVDAVAFEGLVQMELNNLYQNNGGELTLRRVLDLAYSVDCCHVVPGFSLPCSGIGFQFGSSLDLHGDGTDVDFRGWAPDVWCDPQNVLPAALALLQNAGIADGAACEALNAAITAAYEAQPLPEAETLPESESPSEPESADMSGIVLEWRGNLYWPGDQLGGWVQNSYITVYYNGEPTADFTLTPGKKSLCKMEKKEKGAGAGKIKADTRRTGRTDFTVICGEESAVFTWCAQ